MPVGEVFLSASLQVLFDRIASKSLFDFARLWELNTELEDLEQTLSDIQEVLDEAEEKQIKKPSVRRWLQELRHLAYDAEDVIDAFATEHLRCKLEMESQTTNQVLHDISSLPASFKLRYDLRSKIKKITEQFNKFAKRRERLGLTKGDGGSSIGAIQRRPTSSLVTSPNLYGRDTDVEKLIELLLSNEPIDNEVCVIPIVGMGGAGKTTLAQHLYNDERVKKHFNLKGWACVSDDFDVMRITRAILESITKRSHDLKSLDPLQSSLRDELSGKKFLLVLDDVWSKECNYWDQLRSPFRAGAQGSKVVVTTRNKDVALMMRPVSIHDLGLLSNEDCWSLFASHAFEKGNSDASPNLVTIREKIVKKCGGLPLAAKTLGSLFYSKLKYDEWESILNSEIWDLMDENDSILPALRLSYYYLPPYLKRCFGYCSIFPKDYEFDENKLIKLWIAEGFVLQEGKTRMEDIGGGIFVIYLEGHSFSNPVEINRDL